MLLLLWLFNLLFASVVYFQFSAYLRASLGTRAAAAGLLKSIDFNTVFDLLVVDGTALGRFISLAILLTLAYGFFSIFLNGGILHTLFAGRRSKAPAGQRRLAPLFFQGAGKFFGRFFRLFLCSLALWALAFAAMMILWRIFGSATRDTANEALIFWMVLIEAAVCLFLAFLVRMILDYARIRMVVEDESAALGSLAKAISFVFRRFGKAVALWALFLLTGAAVIALYCAATSGIKTYNPLTILLVFLIGQIFIIARGWVRVGLQAGQMDFFRSFVPPAPTESIPAAGEPFHEQ
jgi:hypothetical protein